MFCREQFADVEVLLRFAWADEHLGRPFTAWLLCPHDSCACRKPTPGMFLDLAAKHDLARSSHVADSPEDRAAALATASGRFVRGSDFFGWE